MKLFYCYDTVINITGMASPTATPKEDGTGNFGEYHYYNKLCHGIMPVTSTYYGHAYITSYRCHS